MTSAALDIHIAVDIFPSMMSASSSSSPSHVPISFFAQR